MKNIMKTKMDIYYIKVPTFRRTVQLMVGGDKRAYKKYFKGSPYENDYDLTTGFYCFDQANNCNIIWMRKYSLYTLVHELMHCVLSICHQCGMDPEGEPPAYIYEELFCRIRKQCGDKLEGDPETDKYYD